jgi:3-deoxy-D-manno-octulosonic-acid transferase
VISDRDGGIQVRDSEELLHVMGELLRHPAKREQMGHSGMRIIQENQGALRKTLEVIEHLFKG